MIIAIDFDGTIVEHAYPKIGKQIPFAFEVLRKLKEDGHQLILWTIREGELLDEAVSFCERHGIIFNGVNRNIDDEIDGFLSRKINADLFIDDRNLGGLPDWGLIYQLIQSNEIFQGFVLSQNRPRRRTNLILRLGEFIQTIYDNKPVK
ncbi:MAG: BT0820 family HAD-type phosphatase [Bacteroidales bacterium]